MAAHLACTRETLGDYVANKVIERLANGNYDLDDCRVRVLKHLRERSAGRTGTSQADLSGERAKLAAAQRQGIALKNQIAVGAYAPLETIKAKLMTTFATVRERILSIPGKLADRLVGRSREEIEIMLRDELCEALDELHDPTATDARSGGGRDDPRSAQGPSAAA